MERGPENEHSRVPLSLFDVELDITTMNEEEMDQGIAPVVRDENQLELF